MSKDEIKELDVILSELAYDAAEARDGLHTGFVDGQNERYVKAMDEAMAEARQQILVRETAIKDKLLATNSGIIDINGRRVDNMVSHEQIKEIFGE